MTRARGRPHVSGRGTELGNTRGEADWCGRCGFSFGYADLQMPVGHPM